jgi:hypothetical protein
MAPFRPSGPRLAAYMAAAGAMYFALTASKCRQSTEFVQFIAETGADKCLDKLDNDSDGKIDCDDSDCDAVCAVEVTIDAVPPVINVDTLVLSGQQHNASSVTILSVLPSGKGSAPVLSGETWTSHLSELSARTGYTVTVVGSNGNRRDTASITFTRGN